MPENVYTRHLQAFSELQLQNAELRRRLEDADLCKNNCNASNSLPAQTTQRLEEKQDININMSLPAAYVGDPLKLDLEGVKLELEGVKLEALDGSVKMIPEVMDDSLAFHICITNLDHLVIIVIFNRLTARHRMVRSVTSCLHVNLTMLLGKEGSRRKGCRRGFL